MQFVCNLQFLATVACEGQREIRFVETGRLMNWWVAKCTKGQQKVGKGNGLKEKGDKKRHIWKKNGKIGRALTEALIMKENDA